MWKKGGFFILIIVTLLSAFELEIDRRSAYQGNCILLSITSSQNITRSNISFNDKKYPINRISEDKYSVIISTDYDSPTGDQLIRVNVRGSHGILYNGSIPVSILPGKFRGSTVTVSKEKKRQGVTDWKALRQENRILGRAFRNYAPKKEWSGSFRKPLNRYIRISTPYGAYRRYQEESGDLISTWRHKGIDYSAHLGTFVYAPNDGWVTVSKHMKVHGKTIVIDHGLGVQSSFNHLSRRFVRPREFVKKGQCIGRVGNSGLSTGSHLHYGLSVNNKRVNPDQWYKDSF